MELEQQLKQLIIDSLALEDIGIEDIDNDTVLFSDDGLGLDSVYSWIANKLNFVIILQASPRWRNSSAAKKVRYNHDRTGNP